MSHFMLSIMSFSEQCCAFPFLCYACSVFKSMLGFGNNVERSPLWPVVKDYFHMAYWILNYRPGVTVQPANCESLFFSFLFFSFLFFSFLFFSSLAMIYLRL